MSVPLSGLRLGREDAPPMPQAVDSPLHRRMAQAHRFPTISLRGGAVAAARQNMADAVRRGRAKGPR
jgi:hypothetical protein